MDHTIISGNFGSSVIPMGFGIDTVSQSAGYFASYYEGTAALVTSQQSSALDALAVEGWNATYDTGLRADHIGLVRDK